MVFVSTAVLTSFVNKIVYLVGIRVVGCRRLESNLNWQLTLGMSGFKSCKK